MHRFGALTSVCIIKISTVYAKVESLQLLLIKLEGLLKEHSPMMDAQMERVVDKAIKYRVVFAEVSSRRRKVVRYY